MGPFTAGAIAYAPEEAGVYGLFLSSELIYLGSAAGGPGAGLRDFLARHQQGGFGACTALATQYTWEISPFWATREAQLLREFHVRHRARPRCQAA